MKYKILYGTETKNIDITPKCLSDHMKDNIIYIQPNDEERAFIFTDPAFGLSKSIYIYRTDGQGNIINDLPLYIVDKNQFVYLDLANDMVYVNRTPEMWKDKFPRNYLFESLRQIQHQLKIKHGDFSIEVPEQLMSLRFLTGDEKILEIGGNIGRNSLIMAYIMKRKGKSQSSLVTLECDPDTVKKLQENRDLNGFDFQIEPSALSKRKLIQRGFDVASQTFESEILLDGFKPVSIISWDELKQKYPLSFDTLVLDCEGAFYDIVQDMPEVLDNIEKVFIENDFRDISHKEYVDNILLSRGFQVEYAEDLENGYWWMPCKKDFFQFWKKV